MDIAYQGFGEDMDSDAYAIRKAVDMGLNFFVSNSFSKNLSLYGERVGGLSVVCQDEAMAELVQGQLKLQFAPLSQTRPRMVVMVDIVMNDDALFEEWVQEIVRHA